MADNIEEALIEDQPSPVDLEGTKVILSQMENCICKIVKDDGQKGTGFFCRIPFPDKKNLLNVLITNNHVLNENDIENDNIIKFKFYNKEKKKEEEKEIRIDNSRKKYTIKKEKEGIDITIIEIIQKDEINNFLEMDDEILELDCNRAPIYILHYPKNKRLVSYGLMKNISDGKKINHYCNTERGSSGSPILSLNNFKVIGVHYGGFEKKIKLNFGTFIKYAINEFNNKFKNENKNEYNKVTKTIRDLTNQLNNANSELNDLKSKNISVTLDEMLDDPLLEDQLDESKETIEKLKKEINNYKKKMEESNDSMETMKKNIEELKAQKKKAEDEMNKVESEMGQMRCQVADQFYDYELRLAKSKIYIDKLKAKLTKMGYKFKPKKEK